MSSFVPFDDARALLLAANVIDPALIQWPNEPFIEPTGNPPATWLSVDAVGDMIAPIEIGGDTWHEQGSFMVDVNVPTGTGSDAARKLAKDIANAFRGLGARDVVYRGGSIGQGAITDPKGMWWTIQVAIDWAWQDQNV